jgi:hypothetical protein
MISSLANNVFKKVIALNVGALSMTIQSYLFLIFLSAFFSLSFPDPNNPVISHLNLLNEYI